MRYLRLIIIVVLVAVSYKWVNGSKEVSISTHSYIQQDMKAIIKAAIKEALPDTNEKDINFTQMWTKKLSANSVRAEFIYSFITSAEGEETEIEIEGQATLNKLNLPRDAWSLDSVTLGDESIQFKEPIIIEVQ